MYFIRLKKYLKTLKSFTDRDTEKLSIKPAYVWSVLVAIFWGGLVIVFCGLLFLKIELSNREGSIVLSPTSSVQKLDELKMQSILMDRSKRLAELEILFNMKPAVSDPGL